MAGRSCECTMHVGTIQKNDVCLSSIGARAPAAASGKTAFADFASAGYIDENQDERKLV